MPFLIVLLTTTYTLSYTAKNKQTVRFHPNFPKKQAINIDGLIFVSYPDISSLGTNIYGFVFMAKVLFTKRIFIRAINQIIIIVYNSFPMFLFFFFAGYVKSLKTYIIYIQKYPLYFILWTAVYGTKRVI